MIQIVITEITQQERDYQSWKKVADTGNEKDNGPVYEYVQSTEINEQERVILKQELDEIDLPSVIKAINAL